MIPFIWNVHKRKIYRYRKSSSGCSGLRGWGGLGGVIAGGYMISFIDDKNVLKLFELMVA